MTSIESKVGEDLTFQNVFLSRHTDFKFDICPTKHNAQKRHFGPTIISHTRTEYEIKCHRYFLSQIPVVIYGQVNSK